MDASVFGQFGMESRGHGSSLPNHDRIRTFGGEDFDPFAYLGDFGGADEDHFQGRCAQLAFETAQELALADRAVDLAAVGISANADVEGAQAGLLWVLDFVRQQDGSGTGTERGLQANKLF